MVDGGIVVGTGVVGRGRGAEGQFVQWLQAHTAQIAPRATVKDLRAEARRRLLKCGMLSLSCFDPEDLMWICCHLCPMALDAQRVSQATCWKTS